MDDIKTTLLFALIIITGVFTAPTCYNYLTARSQEIGIVKDLEKTEFVEEKDNYSITYNLDGGSANNPDEYNLFTETFTLNNPTKQGYEFLGWTNEVLTEPTLTVTICQGSSGNIEFVANYVALLETPTVTIEETIVSWNAIENAESYDVMINSDVINLDANTFQIDLAKYKEKLIAGENQIKVRACNSSGIVDVTSDYSEPVIYTATRLEAPDVSIDGTVISWTEIDNADYYHITVKEDGALIETISHTVVGGTSIDFSEYASRFKNGSTYTATVQACATTSMLINSDKAQTSFICNIQEEKIVNLSNISNQNLCSFKDRLLNGEHVGELTLNLLSIDGNEECFAIECSGISSDDFICNQNFNYYEYDATVWEVFERDQTYLRKNNYFETTKFMLDDGYYFKFINIDTSKFADTVECFQFYMAELFDYVYALRKERTQLLGFENSYESTEFYYQTLELGIFNCIQVYDATTNEAVSNYADTFKMNVRDYGLGI